MRSIVLIAFVFLIGFGNFETHFIQICVGSIVLLIAYLEAAYIQRQLFKFLNWYIKVNTNAK